MRRNPSTRVPILLSSTVDSTYVISHKKILVLTRIFTRTSQKLRIRGKIRKSYSYITFHERLTYIFIFVEFTKKTGCSTRGSCRSNNWPKQLTVSLPSGCICHQLCSPNLRGSENKKLHRYTIIKHSSLIIKKF